MSAKTERLETGGVPGAAGTRRAAEILRSGGTVAFPTETVYGLGANALDPSAVAKIFVAKERPAWDPLIVHVEGHAMLEQVVEMTEDVRARAEELMLAFWPGPLTILLPRRAALPDAVTAGRALVGVRMPKHPVARELIRRAGVPVAAPSANRFGRISPTTAAHVLADLDGRIDAVLDGGPTSVGVESTVIGPDPNNQSGWLIYRPGGTSMAALEEVGGTGLFTRYVPDETETPQSQLSPGSGIRHYAPHARLVLVRDAGRLREQSLVEAIGREMATEGSVGVMLPDGWNAGGAREVFRWGPWSNAETLARLLYLGLRMLDERGVKVIVCPVPEMDGLGEALRDRLEKAAK